MDGLGVETWVMMSGNDRFRWHFAKTGHHDGETSRGHIGVIQEGGRTEMVMGGHQDVYTNSSEPCA